MGHIRVLKERESNVWDVWYVTIMYWKHQGTTRTYEEGVAMGKAIVETMRNEEER